MGELDQLDGVLEPSYPLVRDFSASPGSQETAFRWTRVGREDRRRDQRRALNLERIQKSFCFQGPEEEFSSTGRDCKVVSGTSAAEED